MPPDSLCAPDPLAGYCVGTLGGNQIAYLAAVREILLAKMAEAAGQGVAAGRRLERRDMHNSILLLPGSN